MYNRDSVLNTRHKGERGPVRRTIIMLLIGLVILCWWQVLASRQGLLSRELSRDGIPFHYLTPAGNGSRPGVIIAHGFAGSKQLMLGYGYVLAHAGYAVLLFDFSGHGANARPLSRDTLQNDLDTAYQVLIEQPEVDARRVALLGHSMGSGVVMTTAVRQGERFQATVAISPTRVEVSPQAPRNLLLQAGALEPQFLSNAQTLITQAGGEGGDPTQGRARQLIVIPNAEHISILFRDESHRAALQWFNTTFGVLRSSSYADRRIFWYVFHLLAWLSLWTVALHYLGLNGRGAIARQTWTDRVQPLATRRRAIRRTPALDTGRISLDAARPTPSAWPVWVGLVVSAVIASGSLWAIGLVIDVAALGGLQVGGAVGLWFAIAGIVWLMFAWPRLAGLPANAGLPSLRDVVLGLAMFIVLWVAFGALGQLVWLPWLLIPARFVLWPVLALACLPWFIAAGAQISEARLVEQVGGWALQSLALVGGFLLAWRLVPSLGFIVLLLPLLPILTGLLIFVGARLKRPWAFGFGSALFLAWTLAAVFPLTG